jgi:hypothetical protein
MEKGGGDEWGGGAAQGGVLHWTPSYLLITKVVDQDDPLLGTQILPKKIKSDEVSCFKMQDVLF